MTGCILWGIGGLALGLILAYSFRWTDNQAEPDERSSCFGDYPFRSPHIAAERDCGECPHAHDCFDESKYRKD